MNNTSGKQHRRRCSLASAHLHPSNYLSNMLAHEIVDSLKSLYETTTHTHQQYPGQTLSFWDEAENICLLLHFVPKCFFLHAAVIINLDCWNTQLVQMTENNSFVPYLNMILGLLCNSLLCVMVAVCGSSSCRGETAGCDGWMRVCLPVCLSGRHLGGPPCCHHCRSPIQGMVDIGPGLSAAGVPAGVRLWTSH